MSVSRRLFDADAGDGAARGGGGTGAARVFVTSHVSRVSARGAPRPRGETESRSAVRDRHGAELRISNAVRGKSFASRGLRVKSSDVDLSGESDAAVWHISHGIRRELRGGWWTCCERFFGGSGWGCPQRRAREPTRDGRTRTRRPSNISRARPDPVSTRKAHRSRIRACIYGPVCEEKKPWVLRSRARRTCTA